MRALRAFGLACFVALLPAAALALPVDQLGFELYLQVDDGSGYGYNGYLNSAQLNAAPADPTNPDGTAFVLVGGPQVYNTFTIESWDMFLDLDPTVAGNVAVANTTDSTQTFLLTFFLPIGTFPGPPTLISGSFKAATSDGNGDGSTMSTLSAMNAAMYGARINGILVRTLFEDPNAVVAPPNGTTQGPLLTFGIPTPESVNVQLQSSIQVDVQFTLTPHDRGSFQYSFTAEPVPEPATLGLLGAGILGLVVLARRRNAN